MFCPGIPGREGRVRATGVRQLQRTVSRSDRATASVVGTLRLRRSQDTAPPAKKLKIGAAPAAPAAKKLNIDAALAAPTAEKLKTHTALTVPGTEWEIEAVVIGDRTTGKSGITLQPGILYAAGSMTGRHEQFHMIDEESLAIVQLGKRPRAFSTRPLSKGSTNIPSTCVLPQSRVPMRTTVLGIVHANPGVVVLMGGPGAREHNNNLKPFFVPLNKSLLEKRITLDCVAASVVNAVGKFRCICMAKYVKEIILKDTTHYKNLGQLGNFFDHLKINCKLQKPSKALRLGKLSDRFYYAFEWLATVATGVWSVRVLQPKKVDHCVVVVAQGEEKIILDSEEDHPIRLTKESLKMCGGPNVPKLKVAELLQLVPATEHRDNTRE